MTKIGFFSDQVIYGGGESNLVRLACEMSLSHDVTIVAPQSPLLDAANGQGLRIIPIKTRRARWFKGIPICIDRNLPLSRSFDIVHAYSLHVLPMLLGHPKLFWTVHGPWEKPWGLRAKIISSFTRKVIAVSNDVARYCRFPDGKLAVVPLGAVRENECIPVVDEIATLLGREHLNIGVLGRIQQIKGQDIAILAMAELAMRNPLRRFSLNFGGSADLENPRDLIYQQHLEAIANKYSRIDNLKILWHGFIHEPSSFIDAMDLILISSRYESFGMVVVEALARGKLVVAPDIGGPAEILADPATGCKFEAGSTSSMVAALDRCINSFQYSPARQVQRARAFTIESQRNALFEIYGSAGACC